MFAYLTRSVYTPCISRVNRHRGEVNLDFVKKLSELLVNPWQPSLALGRHPCGFCRFSSGPSSFSIDHQAGSTVHQLGISNVWIPGDGVIFVAPSLILHYMDSHEYSPPKEFVEAVMACPPMRSMDYLKLLKKCGPDNILRAFV